MDTDELNKWLTLGANVGVLIGLILLIVEIRQNTDMMRAEMSQARADNRVDAYYTQAFSEHWPRLMASRNDYSTRGEWYASLSDEDYERARYFYLGVTNEMANTAYQCEQGFLDPTPCRSMRAQLIRVLPDLPYVAFNLEATPGPLFNLLQQLGQEDPSLPMLMDDGSWRLPESSEEQPFGRGLGRRAPRISGTREPMK